MIALTAHAMRGDEERARACGCDDYLTKPIDEDRCSRSSPTIWLEPAGGDGGAENGRPPRILIVDDEPFNVDLLEQELELLGYATAAAADGREALERLAAEPFDLVLLDIMMPELDGYQVLRRIKADPELRHIPVIMVSALLELESVVRCIELGAEDYLPKPFEPVLLRARVGACLEKKRLHDREREHLAEIDRQRRRAEALLHAILPAAAVEELIGSGRVAPRRHEEVVVMFADVVGFTALLREAHAPEEVVESLEPAGPRLRGADRPARAREDQDGGRRADGDRRPAGAERGPGDGEPALRGGDRGRGPRLPSRWEMRVGIHIGPVVAGVSAGRSSATISGATRSTSRRASPRSARIPAST